MLNSMEAGDSQTAGLLEVHKIVSQELRHTATVIWQFSIAIVTLQGGAVGLSAQRGFQTTIGRCILATGFFLALCFSLMLMRQATERRCFRDRIRAVEAELRRTYPLFFAPIDSAGFWEFGWFKSTVLAWLLLIESVIGFLFFFVLAGLQVTDRLTGIHAATPTYSLVDSLRSSQPSSPTPEPSPTPAETPIARAIPVASPTLTPLPSPHPTPHRRHPRRHR